MPKVEYFQVTEWLPHFSIKRGNTKKEGIKSEWTSGIIRTVSKIEEDNWKWLEKIKKEIPRSIIRKMIMKKSGKPKKALFRPAKDFVLIADNENK